MRQCIGEPGPSYQKEKQQDPGGLKYPVSSQELHEKHNQQDHKDIKGVGGMNEDCQSYNGASCNQSTFYERCEGN